MDRLDAMGVFARVAELESFTGAAKSLGLPKATVSKAVFQLEDRLGARLLQRTTRRVSLTHDGRAFYERCKDLLVDAEEVEQLFRKSGETLKGRVRIDLPSRMARLRVIPQLPTFLAEHPALELEVGSTDRPVDLVREGYDCVVRVGGTGDAGLIARRIGEMRLVNLASPTYLKARGVPRRLEDLDKHEVVHWAGTFGQKPGGWEYEEDGVWKERPVKGRVTVNNAEAYVAAAVAGLGLIQTPALSLENELKAKALVEVLPRYRAAPMPVSILFPHRRNLSRRVRVFIDWLAARLELA
jgi:DNA-binding transcriptional LysR family regulator